MRGIAWSLAAVLLAGTAQAQSLGGGSLSKVAPGVPVKPTSHLWQSLIPFWGAAAATISGTFTFGQDFSVEGPYTAIQIIFANRGTASITVPNTTVAPSASIADQVTPRDANGNALPWTAVTCGGAAACTVPGSPSGTRAAILLSDVIPLSSVPRSDGGAFPLLFTRALSPASGNYTLAQIPAPVQAAYDGLSGARPWYGYFSNGTDNVTTASNQAALTTSTALTSAGYQLIVGVRYLSPKRIVTIMGCGDSETAGYLTTSGYNGFGMQTAAKLSAQLGIGVSYVAHGFPGTVMGDFAADCQRDIPALQPSIVTIPGDSPNNWNAIGTGAGAAAMAAQQAYQAQVSLGVVDATIQAGAIPTVLTPIPFGSQEAASAFGPYKQAEGAFLRSMSARGAVLLDAQAIISGSVPTASNLQTLPAGFAASDNYHLNDAGQAALAGSLTSLLMPALAR